MRSEVEARTRHGDGEEYLIRYRTHIRIVTGDKPQDAPEAPNPLVTDAYYAGRLDFATVAAVVGTEQAMRMRFLENIINRDLPLPSGKNVALSSDEAFYDGKVPTWKAEGTTEPGARGDDNE